jgi:hypothetical protein
VHVPPSNVYAKKRTRKASGPSVVNLSLCDNSRMFQQWLINTARSFATVTDVDKLFSYKEPLRACAEQSCHANKRFELERWVNHWIFVCDHSGIIFILAKKAGSRLFRRRRSVESHNWLRNVYVWETQLHHSKVNEVRRICHAKLKDIKNIL